MSDTASKQGRASREKGKRGEREVAELLRNYGIPAHRAQQFKGRAGAFDVECPFLTSLGAEVEVKNTSTVSLPAWLKKAWEDVTVGFWPLIFWKRPRDQWYVILPAHEFVALLDKVRMPDGRPD